MLEEKITSIVQPVIKDLGFDIVTVDYKGNTLQITAENPTTGRLGIEDCAAISRAISPVLDVEDPIKGAYRLEVSSPGIDRPLVRAEDYVRFTGHEAKIEVDPPIEENRKRYRGFIKEFENNTLTLTTETGDVPLPFAAIRKAKLVLTDELIKQTAN